MQSGFRDVEIIGTGCFSLSLLSDNIILANKLQVIVDQYFS